MHKDNSYTDIENSFSSINYGESALRQSIMDQENALRSDYKEFCQQFSKIVPPKQCEFRFKNLDYAPVVPTVGRKIETVSTSLSDLVNFWKAKNVLRLPVLTQLSGIIRPRTMTLVLGPPQCGKTSFLKLLAGRLDQSHLEGGLVLNGSQYFQFVAEKVVGYVDQIDNHIPTLTVRETLSFALKCTSKRFLNDKTRLDLMDTIDKNKIEMFLRLLGLENCADTCVGDAMVRGVSGGEKKRVTLGEMLIIPHIAYCMDEISTGLDSATTFDIIQCVRMSMNVLGHTYVMSLLQPPPHVFELFDDVVLLSKGHLAYHG
jgi:ABC-type multidrug transport system ATPase subunit